MDRYSQVYLDKACENYELYNHLANIDKFEAWQITTLFYSALCLAKAYLYNKKIPQNSVNSHESIKKWLTTESEAKRLNVFFFYEKLYFDSRDARYSIKKISKARIQNALKNYDKVKQLLTL